MFIYTYTVPFVAMLAQAMLGWYDYNGWLSDLSLLSKGGVGAISGLYTRKAGFYRLSHES